MVSKPIEKERLGAKMQFLCKKTERHQGRVSKAYRALLLFALMVFFQMMYTVESNAASSDISLQQVSYNSVEVSWSANSEAKHYNVLRAEATGSSTPADSEYEQIAKEITGFSYTDTDLELYKTYYYKIKVVLDNNVATVGPEEITLTYDVLKNINACSNGDTVSITWDAVPGATKYAVTRKYVLNGNVIEDDFEEIVDKNIYTTEGKPEKNYEYTVRPYFERTSDGKVEKFYGENEGKSVYVLTPPQEISATANSYNTATINFSQVDGADSYNIYRSTESDKNYVKVGTVTSGSYTDNKITVGTTYYYKVEASKTGNNVICAGVMSEPAQVCTTLEKPATITAVSKSYNSIKVSWSKVPGAKSYEVYRSSSKSGDYELVATVKKLYYTDKNLETNKNFYYKIVPVSGSYKGTASKVVKKKTVPAATTELTITSIDHTKLQLAWKKVSGADKYIVYRSEKETGGYKKIKTLTATTYLDSTVKAGTPYYYKIVACRGSAKGDGKIQQGVAVTAAVQNVKVTNKSATSNKIAFSKVPGADSYRIYRSTKKNSNYRSIGTTTKLNYTDKTAQTGKKYYYKVCGVINGYEGVLSEAKKISTKPIAIKNLKVEGAGSGKAKLTWDAQKGAHSYQIYVSAEPKSGYRLSKEVTANTYVASLASNSTTYFRVYAVTNGVKGTYKQIAYTAISSITLNATEANMKVGGALQLTASLAPATATDKNITWKTSNKKVATVTDTGVVTGKKNGTCTITATASNGMTATCKVTVSQVIIVLDPGHGGSDPGTSYNGVKEKDINLKIALYAKQELETYKNVKVIMTRSTDTYPSLIERSQIAANYNADFFISIHCNMLASKTRAINGSEVYASLNPNFSVSTARMGNLVIGELTKVGMTNRGVKTVRGDNGADYYAVIRNTVAKGIPAILIEEGYLSGSVDYGVLTSDIGQRKLGVANATAIATYFELEK